MARREQPRSARDAALQVLVNCQRRGAWSDSALSSTLAASRLSGRDAALASHICYGVQQNQMLLDYWLGVFCTVPIRKLEPAVRWAMEMGMYQVVFLERVPDAAAVNESVELVRRYSRNPNSTRLANGVLRSFVRRREALPQPDSLSVRCSHPQWLVEQFAKELGGEGVEALLRANNSRPPTVIHCNPLKTTPEELKDRLEREGVQVEPSPFFNDSFFITGSGALEELDSFREGWFQVQDTASRFAVLAAAPAAGMDVLDVCSAPGGKSLRAAMMMENRGSILACDLQEKKLQRIRTAAERLGVCCITERAMDGRVFDPAMEKHFDLVLTDVPCSGLGIIRKKPDIRLKQPEQLQALPSIQRDILDNASRYVKPGGVLLYSTCTVLRRENQDVVQAFLADCGGFDLEPFTLPKVGSCSGMITLWPHIHGTDGFFMAKLRKRYD